MKVPRSLNDVEPGHPFPYPLSTTRSALILFAAGWYGKNDAYWIAKTGVSDVLCIDTDAEKMHVMKEIYPKMWTFIADDAFNMHNYSHRKWDIITADCPLTLLPRMWEFRHDLLRFAKDALIMNIFHYGSKKKITITPRSATVAWAVIQDA